MSPAPAAATPPSVATPLMLSQARLSLFGPSVSKSTRTVSVAPFGVKRPESASASWRGSSCSTQVAVGSPAAGAQGRNVDPDGADAERDCASAAPSRHRRDKRKRAAGRNRGATVPSKFGHGAVSGAGLLDSRMPRDLSRYVASAGRGFAAMGSQTRTARNHAVLVA